MHYKMIRKPIFTIIKHKTSIVFSEVHNLLNPLKGILYPPSKKIHLQNNYGDSPHSPPSIEEKKKYTKIKTFHYKRNQYKLENQAPIHTRDRINSILHLAYFYNTYKKLFSKNTLNCTLLNNQWKIIILRLNVATL